jgi:putative endonuclease
MKNAPGGSRNGGHLKQYFVYILASKPRGTLYIGVTNDLVRRGIQHRDGMAESFTKRYGVKLLIYYEVFDEILLAIQREKSLKRWPREWKLNLVERLNPHWEDLMPAHTSERSFRGTSERRRGS